MIDQPSGEPRYMAEQKGLVRLSDELIAVLRERVAQQYYDKPQVVEIVARAILNSRGVYL